jgi:hypothetical protein
MQAETLFDAPPLARHNDPATSKAAARRMAVVAPNLQRQLIDLLDRHPRGLTKDECCELLDVDPRRWPSVASALSQLKKAGQVRWSGEPRNAQNVWCLWVAIEDVPTGGRL